MQQSGCNMVFSKQHSNKEERRAWDFNPKTLSYLPSLVNVISNKSMSIFFLFVILKKTEKFLHHEAFLFDTNFPSKTKKSKAIELASFILYTPTCVHFIHIHIRLFISFSLWWITNKFKTGSNVCVLWVHWFVMYFGNLNSTILLFYL